MGGLHHEAVQVASLQHWQHHSLTVVRREMERAPYGKNPEKLKGAFCFSRTAGYAAGRRQVFLLGVCGFRLGGHFVPSAPCLHHRCLRWKPDCGSAHSWSLYSVVSLGHQAGSTMTCYPMQFQYPDTEPTSPCPILIIPSTRLGFDKYQFYSHGFDLTRFETDRL